MWQVDNAIKCVRVTVNSGEYWVMLSYTDTLCVPQIKWPEQNLMDNHYWIERSKTFGRNVFSSSIKLNVLLWISERNWCRKVFKEASSYFEIKLFPLIDVALNMFWIFKKHEIVNLEKYVYFHFGETLIFMNLKLFNMKSWTLPKAY